MYKDSSQQLPVVGHAVLRLREFEACEVVLSDGAYATLHSRYAGKIDATHTEHKGVYRISARDYVGCICLSEHMSIAIQPKAQVANLFYMLCADVDLAQFYPGSVELAQTHDIFGFVANAFLNLVEGLLQSGLYKAHLSHEEDLPLVRGRIMLGAQVSKYGELKHRHVCAYTVLTEDTPENRVVAATLRLLPALLYPENRGNTSVETHSNASLQPTHPLARRVRALIPRFEGISMTSRREALALLPGIRIHRLNASYGPVLALCRLLLRGLSMDERAGPHPFASFLVETPRLFESFVTARLRAALPQYGLRAVAQRSDYLDEEGRVLIRPDIMVYPASGETPLLVLDTKYRLISAGDSHLNRDLYQLSAYMDRYGLWQGMLVYPQFSTEKGEEPPAHAPLRVQGTAKRLHIATLNLGAPTPAQLDESCARLVKTIAGLAGEKRSA